MGSDGGQQINTGAVTDFVGSRIRIRSIENGTIRSAFVKSADDNAINVLFDQTDMVVSSGSQLIEGIKSGLLLTAIGQVTLEGRDRATLHIGKSPNSRFLDFRGSFLREDLVAQITANNVRVNCKILGLGDNQFLAESATDVPLNSTISLTVTDEGRSIEYDAYVERTWAHGKAFRIVGALQPATRILTMYWHKLVKTA